MKERVPLVIANWKLHGGIDLLAGSIATLVRKKFAARIAVCPPYLYVREMVHFLGSSQIMVGTQNVSKYEAGAYTGETSAQLIAEAGAKLCLVGHSERRQMFNETDAACAIKVSRVLASGMMPILCIGENEQQREAGVTHDVLSRQLQNTLKDHSSEEKELLANKLVIAYEPVWAIGTGLAATPEDAQAVHEFIRSELAVLYGEETARKINILYGGSANKSNANELLGKPDIDGLLVGGASLDPEHFMQICLLANNYAESLQE
ncbi:triose-phosphate isomerase [Pseudomaricurvus alcaniphilus]|uniref:triose-phosphate isomerase n=1 Tax=Pseudomaricurvus alcaniphilus TaxID=1166482 RepID=UPI00140CA444|nr:triose-phosphate isomerase [Pseudomaricurvus alcaniphilus]NHN36503.1 triose-phosphate isomerase [Pseudomaricurvus alcaniphilus]